MRCVRARAQQQRAHCTPAATRHLHAARCCPGRRRHRGCRHAPQHPSPTNLCPLPPARPQAWRARELSGVDWGLVQKRMLTVLASAVLPAAAILYAATNGFSGRRMRESIAQPKSSGGSSSSSKQQRPKQQQQQQPAARPKESHAAPVAAVAAAASDLPSSEMSEMSSPPSSASKADASAAAEERKKKRRGLLG